jgi:hypothetical protein
VGSLTKWLGYGVWGTVDSNNPLEPVAVTINRQPGTFSYDSGVSGTVNVGAGKRVIAIAAHSTVGGSMTINGGSTITIPANVSMNIDIQGTLVAPTLVFTNTDTFFVEELI